MSAHQLAQADALIVSAIRLFSFAPQPVVSTIAAALSVRDFAASETIVAPPDAERSVCFVLAGAVRVAYRTRTGRRLALVERGPGELLGLLEHHDREQPEFVITAAVVSCVAFMRCVDLARILDAHPEILARWRSQGVDYTRLLCERAIDLALLRLTYHLCSERPRASDVGPARILTAAAIPSTRVGGPAGTRGTDRDAVSREVGRLERCGVLAHARDCADTGGAMRNA